jgi:hypothetical protein
MDDRRFDRQTAEEWIKRIEGGTGVEPSPYLVERAKQLYPQPNRNFILGNAYALPFSDGTFDAAFSVTVWHLLSDLQTAANPNADFVWKNLAAPNDILHFHTVDEIENSLRSARLGRFETHTFRPSSEGPDLFLAIKGGK